MVQRAIKLSYTAGPSFGPVLAELRRRQSRVVRTAYCRFVDGLPRTQLYRTLRAHPVGQGLHTWLTLSAMKKAGSLYNLCPEGDVVFGGRKNLTARAQGKLTAAEWKSKRLLPLYIEGHAQSYGTQGGNHLVTLDLAHGRLVFHGPENDFALRLNLSGRSKALRARLEALQARCETLRDTPFSVSITESHVSLAWGTDAAPACPSIRNRVLALDLNPNRIGWAVVEPAGEDGGCRVVSWGLFEYAELNRKLKLASDDPRSVDQGTKRKHELSILAKRVELLVRHYQAAAVITERLEIPAREHGKGTRFNRLLNQCWFRRGFLEVLLRRLHHGGIEHAEVNPAYSSKLGNLLWADSLRIPDPACAAVELGRRALFPIPITFTQETPVLPTKPNASHRWKDGRRAQPPRGSALVGWRKVWSHVTIKAGDMPRRFREHLPPLLPPGNPRLAPLVNPRSRVLRFEPRVGASSVFGAELHASCAASHVADFCRCV